MVKGADRAEDKPAAAPGYFEISRKQIALFYARKGLPVIPLHGRKDNRCTCGQPDCARPGQHPRTDRDATTDKTVIDEMWRTSPRARVGIPLKSHVVIVVEGEVGKRTMRELEKRHGELPSTVTITDQKKQTHIFKSIDGESPRVDRLGDGVRVLASDSYITPSARRSSSESPKEFYERLGIAGAQPEASPAPQWLLDLLIAGGKEIPFHPIASVFPLMTDADFDELVDDIRRQGLRQPLVMFQDQLLDGRNRYLACRKLNVKPVFTEYEGNDPVGFVMSMNLHRRHLNPSQRAAIALKLVGTTWGGDRRSDQAVNMPLVSQEAAAKALDVSERSVRYAHVVRATGVPELMQRVEQGKMAVSTAAKLAGQPPKEQRRRLAEKGKRRRPKEEAEEPSPSTVPSEGSDDDEQRTEPALSPGAQASRDSVMLAAMTEAWEKSDLPPFWAQARPSLRERFFNLRRDDPHDDPDGGDGSDAGDRQRHRGTRARDADPASRSTRSTRT